MINQRYRVAICGPPLCGKRSIAQAAVELSGDVSNERMSIITIDHGIQEVIRHFDLTWNGKAMTMQLHSGGVLMTSPIAEHLLKDADAVCYAAEASTEHDEKTLYTYLRVGEALSRGPGQIPWFIAATKVDLVNDERDPFSHVDWIEPHKVHRLAVWHGIGLERLLDEITRSLR